MCVEHVAYMSGNRKICASLARRGLGYMQSRGVISFPVSVSRDARCQAVR